MLDCAGPSRLAYAKYSVCRQDMVLAYLLTYLLTRLIPMLSSLGTTSSKATCFSTSAHSRDGSSECLDTLKIFRQILLELRSITGLSDGLEGAASAGAAQKLIVTWIEARPGTVINYHDVIYICILVASSIFGGESNTFQIVLRLSLQRLRVIISAFGSCRYLCRV